VGCGARSGCGLRLPFPCLHRAKPSSGVAVLPILVGAPRGQSQVASLPLRKCCSAGAKTTTCWSNGGRCGLSTQHLCVHTRAAPPVCAYRACSLVHSLFRSSLRRRRRHRRGQRYGRGRGRGRRRGRRRRPFAGDSCAWAGGAKTVLIEQIYSRATYCTACRMKGTNEPIE
jgi:hypothetical protein